MNEKFTISLEVVVGSKNRQQLNNLSNSLRQSNKESQNTTKSLNEMTNKLNNIKNMSFANVLSYFGSCQKSIKQASSAAKDFSKTLFSLQGIKALSMFPKDLKDILKEGRTFDKEKGLKENIKDSLVGASDLLFDRNNQAGKAVKALGNSFLEMGNVIRKSCIPALAILAKYLIIIKGITGSIKNAISVAAMGDEIKDEAQKVHLSTTAYQEWGYVLEQNGVSIANLKTGMRIFANAVATGSDSLKKYGITATDVDSAFEQAIFNIQNLGSETEKVAALTELFGSRASDLMPIMNLTNQETVNLMMAYRTLGGTMSNELIAMSDRTTDNILAMKKAWQGLRNTLAYAIIPIVNKVVQWLTVAIGTINLFLKALFNIKETFGSNKTGKNSSSLGSGLSNNLNNSLNTAKELKKTIAGFDELNVLNGNSSTGADSGSIDTGVGDVDYDMGDSTFLSDETIEKLQKVSDFINKYKEQIQIIIPILTIAAGIALIFFGHPLAGIALAGLGIAIGAGNGAWDKIFNYQSKIQAIISTLSIAAGIALIFFGHPVAGAALAGIGLALTNNDLWSKITGKIKSFCQSAATLLSNLVQKIKNLLNNILQAVKGLWTSLKPVLDIIGSGVKWLINNIIAPIVKGIVDIIKIDIATIKGILSGLITFLKGVFTGDWKSAWEGLKTIAKSVVSGIVGTLNSIKNAFSTVLENIGSLVSKILGKVGDLVEKVINKALTIKAKIKILMKDVATIITGKLSNLWTTLKTNIGNGFKNVLNKVISMVEGCVNKIANKFNQTGFIRGINKILGTNIQLPTISIPRLAKGGVIQSPTVAMMGEYAGASNNPEIATPQKLLTQIINQGNNELADIMIQLTRQLISAIEKVDMEVKIGDDVIAKSANRGNQQYKNRTGKPLFGY